MRKLLVASQNGGVGKTTTSINLAAATAQAGARVLLIDADPIGNVSSALKLVEHPRRQALRDAGLDLPGVVVSEVAPHLDVLSPYDTELCSDDSFTELLELALSPTLAAEYGCVIVNTPPFLGANPTQLLSRCDELVLVMRADPLASRTLPAFLQLIQQVPPDSSAVRLLGILLTLPEGNEGQRWAQELRGRCGGRIFPETIPHDERIQQLEEEGRIVSISQPASPAAAGYVQLAARLELSGSGKGGPATTLSELLQAAQAAAPPRIRVAAAPAPASRQEPHRPGQRAAGVPTSPAPSLVPAPASPPPAPAGRGDRRAAATRRVGTLKEVVDRQAPPRSRTQPASGQPHPQPAAPPVTPSAASPQQPERPTAPGAGAKQPTPDRPNEAGQSSQAFWLVMTAAIGGGFAIGFLPLARISLPVIIGVVSGAAVLACYYLMAENQEEMARQRRERAARAAQAAGRRPQGGSREVRKAPNGRLSKPSRRSSPSRS